MRTWLSLRWLLPLALCVAVAACSSLRATFVKTPSLALPPTVDTPSARYINSELDAHPGLTGMRLLTNNTDALMSRIALIDHARGSIDLQYYLFQNDATGRLVAQRLLAAADRGVRVRMLLDDIGLANENHMLDALDAQKNIQVRLFNPFRTRNPSTLSKIAQFILEGRRLNRRMHNKSLIVDNTVAIIGGRNIGDDYFDASSANNFRDLDLLAIGPVVAAASRAFDEYWNSDATYPVTAFRTTHDPASDLVHLRVALERDARAFAQSDYAQASLTLLPEGASSDRSGEWFWGKAVLLADAPEKIQVEADDPAMRIGAKIKIVVDGAQNQLLLISPYFIPGKHGTEYLSALARRGVEVKALTNSLASTDEPVAEAGYLRNRVALLRGGVQLYELRPAANARQSATVQGTSSGVSLHAKAIVVDGRYVFVGSMNLDPRSRLLNTEMGVLADCPQLAESVARFFAAATTPTDAFHVQLQTSAAHSAATSHLLWTATDHGKAVRFNRDPGATAARRLQATLFGLLPIEGLL